MRVALLTREYPPTVYGGVGEHVTQLVPRLRRRIPVDVHCYGRTRPGAVGHTPPVDLAGANMGLQAVAVAASMANAVAGARIVHSHSWYATFAGHLARSVHAIPHVVTAHSLEPSRPWKQAQLNGGYRVSSMLERVAFLEADRIIAVSNAMREELLATYQSLSASRITVIHNGVDCREFAPDRGNNELTGDTRAKRRKVVLCVGRITPQKGLTHLLRAAESFAGRPRLIIVADSWDSEKLRDDFGASVAAARRAGVEVCWISRKIPREALVELYNRADVFASPSMYEPLGIVNLEAMACSTPVVSTDVGGIPEVVDNGTTGLLVPVDIDREGSPADAEKFARMFATSVNELLADPDLAAQMGAAGRRRAMMCFSWERIAEDVLGVYRAAS
ncbi:glycogen synthase [Catellatospora methionotrophica]|uniref:glycogen synthase n=1 Tax=Catellatospora methionotrophica TaxID=121620 RepID=UPI0033EE306F